MRDRWWNLLTDLFSREDIAVFRSSSIQICIIYAHPSLTVSPFHHEYISQPLWVITQLHEVRCQQFVYFFFNDLVFLQREVYLFLFDRTDCIADVSAMYHHSRVYSRHVIHRERKEVIVFSKEIHYVDSDLWVHVGPDNDHPCQMFC